MKLKPIWKPWDLEKSGGMLVDECCNETMNSTIDAIRGVKVGALGIDVASTFCSSPGVTSSCTLPFLSSQSTKHQKNDVKQRTFLLKRSRGPRGRWNIDYIFHVVIHLFLICRSIKNAEEPFWMDRMVIFAYRCVANDIKTFCKDEAKKTCVYSKWYHLCFYGKVLKQGEEHFWNCLFWDRGEVYRLISFSK